MPYYSLAQLCADVSYYHWDYLLLALRHCLDTDADDDIEMYDVTVLSGRASIVDVEMEDLELESRLRMLDESSLYEITTRLAALRLYEVDNEIDQITKGMGAHVSTTRWTT